MNQAVPNIFDAERKAQRQRRTAVRQQAPAAAHWLADAMADDIAERLGFMRWERGPALISGLGGGTVATALGLDPPGAAPDYERPIGGGPFALIVTLAELDAVNDLPGAFIHLRHALAPGGVLLAAMTGAGSLPKLRAALLAADGERPAARVHPQIDNRMASALLQRAGFARQVVDHHALTVRYGSLDRLVSDLRDQGLTSVLSDRAPPIGKQGVERARDAFANLADADGKTSEQFEILTLTAWKD